MLPIAPEGPDASRRKRGFVCFSSGNLRQILAALEFLAIGGIGIASGALARRHAPAVAALLVASYGLSWSWVEAVRTGASVAFWGLLWGFVAAVALSHWSALGRRWLCASGLLTVAVASTMFWSVDPSYTSVEVVKFAAVLLVAACVGALVQRSGTEAARLTTAFAVLAPGAVACSLLAALVAWGDESVDTAGASGFFNGPNVLGIFLALSLPFLLVHPFVRRRLVATLTCVAAVAFVSALSAGRTGLLALLVAVTVLALGARRPRLLILGIGVCAVSIAVALAWSPRIPTLGSPITGPNQVDQLLGGSRPGNQSRLSALVGARDEGWAEAIRLLDERPLGGHGFGTGSTLFDRYGSHERFTYFVGAFAEGVNPHNSYLQMLLELGFLLSLIFFAPLLFAAAVAWRLVASGRADGPRLAFCAALAAGIVAAGFESTLTQFGALTLLSWVSAAAVVGLWLRDRSCATGSE